MEQNELVDLLYEGATDEQAMAAAVQEFIQRTSSRGAQFGTLHRTGGAGTKSLVVGLDQADLKTYLENYTAQDPRWPLHLKFPGRILTIPENLPDRQSFDESALVNDLLIKRDAYQSMGVSFPIDHEYQLYFYLLRGHQDGGYRKAEVDELAWFLPALKRSLMLRLKFDALESTVASLKALVDKMEQPVFLVSRTGSLTHANHGGHLALRQADFLAVRNGRLEPRNPRDATALMALI